MAVLEGEPEAIGQANVAPNAPHYLSVPLWLKEACLIQDQLAAVRRVSLRSIPVTPLMGNTGSSESR